MRDSFERWRDVFAHHEQSAPVDELGEILTEAIFVLADLSDPPPQAIEDDWMAVLIAETAINRAVRHPDDGHVPVPTSGRWRIVAHAPAHSIRTSSEVRRRLLSGGDPSAALADAEQGWRLTSSVSGAEGLASGLAAFAALAAAVIGDHTALEIDLERSERCRATARESFVAAGSDLIRSWAHAVAAGDPTIAGGDPRQQAEVAQTPLFAKTARDAAEHGIRLGFGDRPPLTPHQRRLLEYSAAGLSSREIGAKLGVSPRTVETHLGLAREAMGATSLAAAVARAGLARMSAETASLTARDREIIELVGRGWRNSAIADELDVSVKAVEKHLARVFARTGVQNRVELANLDV